MGENDNKYGQYFYDKVPASAELNKNGGKKKSIFTVPPSEVPKTFSDSADLRKFEFISGAGSSNVYPEKVATDQNTGVFSNSQCKRNSGVPSYSKSSSTEEQMVRNVGNSVGKKKPVKTSTTKEKDAITVFGSMSKPVQKAVAGICVSIAFFLGVSSAKTIEKIKDSSKVHDYVEPYNYVYYDNKFVVDKGRLDANGDPYYDYDTLGMGRDIAAAEDPEAALYAVYSRANYKKYDITHEAFSYAKEANPEIFGESNTFKEYATSLGCLDKDGNIDYDRYEEITEARLLAKQSLAENTFINEAVK